MLRKYIIQEPTFNMYNGKQGEQLLKRGAFFSFLFSGSGKTLAYRLPFVLVYTNNDWSESDQNA